MNVIVLAIIFLAILALLVVSMVVLQEEQKNNTLEDINGSFEEHLEDLTEINGEESSGETPDDTGAATEVESLDEIGGRPEVEAEREKMEEELEAEFTEEELELPFDPINTFEPEPEQWSDLYQDLHKVPWPDPDESRQLDYDDRTSPDKSSKSLHEAIRWIIGANTEAIHQREKYDDFFEKLYKFIEEPRAAGAEEIQKRQWREKSANMSRLLGERLLVLAVGLSCYGPVEMDSHREALKELLSRQWNADGLEAPLIYQALGRLGLLTPTDTGDLQEVLKSRVSGCAACRQDTETNRLGLVRFHSLLLALSAGPGYPFPRGQKQLSRLWHWEGSDPPLASWEHLPAALYALWNYHWINGEQTEAVRDLAALFGSWWEESTPVAEFFEENPEVCEAILMCCWAWAPEHSMVWDKLEERYEELNFEDRRLIEMTEGYLEWSEYYRENSEPPPESFTVARFPPENWIRPLPTDILDDASQPPFKFPKSWTAALSHLRPPDLDSLVEKHRPEGV